MNAIGDQRVHILCGIHSISAYPLRDAGPDLLFPTVFKLIQTLDIILDRMIDCPALLSPCFHEETGRFSHLIKDTFPIFRLVLSSQKHDFPNHAYMIVGTQDTAVYDIVKQPGRLVIQQLSNFFSLHSISSFTRADARHFYKTYTP